MFRVSKIGMERKRVWKAHITRDITPPVHLLGNEEWARETADVIKHIGQQENQKIEYLMSKKILYIIIS